MDGGADLRHHFALSGEEQAPQVIVDKDGTDMPASAIAKINVAKREYQKEYMEYWNSTAQLTGTGRPVDGFICPIAPHAAVIPNQYDHVGYSSFVNVLDYPSVVIPVTFADKAVDTRKPDAFATDLEQHIEWDCEYFRYLIAIFHLWTDVSQMMQPHMMELQWQSSWSAGGYKKRRC